MVPKPMFTWMIPLHGNMACFSYWQLQDESIQSFIRRDVGGVRENIIISMNFKGDKENNNTSSLASKKTTTKGVMLDAKGRPNLLHLYQMLI